MGAVFQFIQTLGKILPYPVFVALLVLVAIPALPAWVRSVRTKRVRVQVRRLARARASDRAREEAVAFDLAGDNAALLVALADEAVVHQLKGPVVRAVERIETVGGHPKDVARLRSWLVPPAPPVAAHPLEAAAAIRILLDEGAPELARARLAEARRRHPDDPDLQALARDLGKP